VRLTQGQYLYSLGNPLDLGFAISEGAYNGVITRSFYDQLMFTGPINSGMSGGPSVTADGSVAGVNVSKRLDGELVSFLVPIRYAQELLKKVAEQTPKAPADFTADRGGSSCWRTSAPWSTSCCPARSHQAMGPYQVPVRESEQMRCWGRSNVKAEKTFTVDNTNCAMESAIFVSGSLQTGQIAIRHQFMRSTGAGRGPLRPAGQRLVQERILRQQQGQPHDRRRPAPKSS
jgi:serine protease Do